MQRNAKPKRGRNGSKYPGICAWAKELGVHRNTVLKVLKGQWQSRILTARLKHLRGQPLTKSDLARIEDFNRRRTEKGLVPG